MDQAIGEGGMEDAENGRPSSAGRDRRSALYCLKSLLSFRKRPPEMHHLGPSCPPNGVKLRFFIHVQQW